MLISGDPDGVAGPARPRRRSRRPQLQTDGGSTRGRERTGPMTRLFNDPAAFADEMLDGFVAAHADCVRRVPGGVVREHRRTRRPGRRGDRWRLRALPGLRRARRARAWPTAPRWATSSPRPRRSRSCSVAKAADAAAVCCSASATTPATCCTSAQAPERLNADGIRCPTVPVTDDISSAPAEKSTSAAASPAT